MVNDGGYPFMFDGTLSFDRVLNARFAGIDRLERPPPSTTSWSPSPRKRGEASFGNVVHLTTPQA